MKKIMIIALVAILFASCSSPVMPVDNTDDRLVGTWNYDHPSDAGSGFTTFNADGTGVMDFGFFGEKDIVWTAQDNLLTIVDVETIPNVDIIRNEYYDYGDPFTADGYTFSSKH